MQEEVEDDAFMEDQSWQRQSSSKALERQNSWALRASSKCSSGSCTFLWGRGDVGQIGDGQNHDVHRPTLSENLQNRHIVFVTANLFNTIFVSGMASTNQFQRTRLHAHRAKAHKHLPCNSGSNFDGIHTMYWMCQTGCSPIMFIQSDLTSFLSRWWWSADLWEQWQSSAGIHIKRAEEEWLNVRWGQQ